MLHVTHWTFANCEVRVIGRALSLSRFSGRSLTVFRPMAHVPRSVVRSLAPKPKNLDFGQLSDWLSGGLVPVQGCACIAYGVEWDRHIPRVGMSGYHRHLGGTSWTILEPSTQGEARDRGKGIASG
uniref:Uncharacterized protein n=1 Tax=Ananas comosus var. bracteatus TaxID=296719 RepID=A0A6V7PEW0_ANACO|nr:unnamed protein product [Ananas comosus var. bracteatus]